MTHSSLHYGLTHSEVPWAKPTDCIRFEQGPEAIIWDENIPERELATQFRAAARKGLNDERRTPVKMIEKTLLQPTIAGDGTTNMHDTRTSIPEDEINAVPLRSVE